MSTSNALIARREIVRHLKSFAPLTALVSAGSIYPENTPANVAWPFIRYSSFAGPWGGQCYSGSTEQVSLHVFSNGPGTDHVHNAAAQVIEAMKTLQFPGLAEAEWTQTTGPMNDSPEGETYKWHAVVQFRVSIAR